MLPKSNAGEGATRIDECRLDALGRDCIFGLTGLGFEGSQKPPKSCNKSTRQLRINK
jgi:hypothetical protein